MITYPTNTEQRNKCNIKVNKNKAIELSSISKKYPFLKRINNGAGNSNIEYFWALRDVSLDVYYGEVIGLIGRNGAGKTTLLNIMVGTLTPTEGKISVNGRVIGLFALGVGFQDELTGRENIFLNGAIMGATKKELKNKMRDIIDFSELGAFINMPLGSYSQGMRLRLGFSIIANLDFDVLIVDEVLAVGDTLFQNKCYERLMDFRRLGKTLVITSQSMSLIERLCDKVALLGHGHLLFFGTPSEALNRYRTLLNTESFFVGPGCRDNNLIKTTKKWADDISDWGKKLGTKEVVIESVDLINKFRQKCEVICSGEPLRVKVNFSVRNNIKEVHFGIAIFRKDGVYCYGPNTYFDGYRIPELKKGKGYFILRYHKLLLAPGEYRLSVAIWDKNETVAFDYHNGYYKLIVSGYSNTEKELLNIPFVINSHNYMNRLLSFRKRMFRVSDLSLSEDSWRESFETGRVETEFVKMLNYLGEVKDIFITNESVILIVNFSNLRIESKNPYLWVGIYRDDGIFCQRAISKFNKNKEFQILFPKLSLLPGSYKVSVGIWDGLMQKFLMHQHPAYRFRMFFNRHDHGTVYLEHKWKWSLP